MNTRRKFVYIFCFILLNAFLVVGFLVIRDATSINKLRKEVNELTKLDVTKDRYNRKIKTTGKYALVESSIKDYLDGYALEVQQATALMHDPQLSKILSYDNYLEDGPDFKNSIAYLEESKEKFNDQIDALVYDLEEEQIMNHIYERTKDEYYVDLYHELMFDDDMRDGLNESKELFQQTRSKMNNVYDVSLEVLNFLKTYNDSWELDNGEIKFKTNDLRNYYDTLIAKLDTKKDA
ncbi:MAG: hypothetical protein IKQ06_01905 [Bacilli bacterium]|nr:hypothetical protein [Bacilli bacterium]